MHLPRLYIISDRKLLAQTEKFPAGNIKIQLADMTISPYVDGLSQHLSETDLKECYSLLIFVAELFKYSNGLFQLREKDLPKEALLFLIKTLVLLRDHQHSSWKILLNSDLDIALLGEADGVHLNKESLPITEVKRLLQNPSIANPISKGNFIIGYSAHSREEAIEAEKAGASFVTFSPIFDTPSKRPFGKPQGLDQLYDLVSSVIIPVYALGGIEEKHCHGLREHGVYGIAVIREILKKDSLALAVKKLTSALGA